MTYATESPVSIASTAPGGAAPACAKAQAITPDLAQARAFLGSLDPSGAFTFQTFDDRSQKRRALVTVLHSKADALADALQRLAALNAQGAGVFVTVNGTDGRGRKAGNVRAVRALFVDLDDAQPSRDLARFGLEPSLCVESSPGKHHVYWLADAPAGTPLFAEFSAAQRRIAGAFGGDLACTDLPRVLRVPGFVHGKGEPFVSRLVAGTGRRYSAAELGAWLGTLPEAPGASPAAAPVTQATGELADLVPPETVQELRAALMYLVDGGHVDPADRKLWVDVGHELRCAGDAGLELWIEFSKRADKFDPTRDLDTWATFKPTRTGYAAVFKRAQAAGWVNPRSASAAAVGGERQKGPGGTFVVHAQAPGAAAPGVYFIGMDKSGDELPPLWLCAPLHVRAKTRGAKSTDWGLLLEWADADHRPHRWAVPAELLAGDSTEVRAELLRLGLAVSPGRRARELLGAYLQSWGTEQRARCVDRLGWCGPVFVMPDEAIGAEGEAVVFQSPAALEPGFAQSGTLDQWRASVAALAAGNSRLQFAISCAFAPTLAHLVGEDSGGFHLRGKSSSGKSTALAVAASVWGSPSDYPRLWRATANGLEGLAAVHNDSLLILDELSQVDPREAGEAAYLLANGQGKTRASRAGTARQAARWRLLFLSAGEESLSAMMGRAGKRANAGQEVRLADIEADAGAGLGAFETLHGLPGGAALALALKDAATLNHGTAGAEWARAVVRDRARLGDRLGATVRAFVAAQAPANASGQVQRVARRFGLVAAAGELATEYGLTGWGTGAAAQAAALCFASWLAGFGGGNREDCALLAQVRGFLELHGASRFQPIGDGLAGDDYEARIGNRAGFSREGPGGAREFLVLPEVFKREVCAGFDAKEAARTLAERGALLPDRTGKKMAQAVALPGLGKTRVYVLTALMLSDACE